MPDRPTVLVTRPSPGDAEFAQALAGLDVDVICAPVLEIALLEAPDFAGIETLFFTSTNGVRAVAERLSGMRAICVGARTTEAARQAGADAEEGGADVEALIARLIAEPPKAPCLHLHGTHARGDLAERLTAAGIETAEAVVYDQRTVPLTEEARQVLAGDTPVILPLFSPRTAEIVARETEQARAPLVTVHMSAAVAEAWFGPSPSASFTAASPDAASMRDAVAEAAKTLSALRPGQGRTTI